MTNNPTYEDLLNTFNSFGAYLHAIKDIQEEKAEQERREAQRQHELEEQRKQEQAIADDKAAYQRAQRTNTKAVYEKYLKSFANGAYRTEAKTKVDHFLKLEQEKQAQEQRQREAEAQRQREQAIANDHQAYESARRINTKAAYETYLRNYPFGLHKTEATTKLNEFLATERAIAAQQQQELAAQQAKAQSEYDDHQAFEEAKRINTRASYSDYLTFFPTGIHRDQCEKYRNTIYDFSGKPFSEYQWKFINNLRSITSYTLSYNFEHELVHNDFGITHADFLTDNFLKTTGVLVYISEYGSEIFRFSMRSNFISKVKYGYERKLRTYIKHNYSTLESEMEDALKNLNVKKKVKDEFLSKALYIIRENYFNYDFPKNKSGINIFISSRKYGLRNASKIIIHPQYESAKCFGTHAGIYYYRFSNNYNSTIINSQGETFSEIDFTIDDHFSPAHGLFRIKKNDKYGLMNIENKKVVVYPEYNNIHHSYHKPSYYILMNGLKTGVIDGNGHIVKEVKFRFPPLDYGSEIQ